MTGERLRELIASALEYAEGSHTVGDVLAQIAEGRLQLWVDGDSIIVTEVCVYPQLKSCFIFLVAGNGDEVWGVLEPRVEAWARSIGCARMEGAGRPGWARTAVGHGYSERRVVMSKML